MDPNEVLKRLRQAVISYDEAYRECTNEENEAADEMVDAFEALDKWLKTGGFLPSDWAKVTA